MQRRKFLKLLGLAPFVAVLAAKVGVVEVEPLRGEDYPALAKVWEYEEGGETVGDSFVADRWEVWEVEPSEASWRRVTWDSANTVTIQATTAPGDVWISHDGNTWQLVGPEHRA